MCLFIICIGVVILGMFLQKIKCVMITPDKYMNIDLSTLNVGGCIIRALLQCPMQKYEELQDRVLLSLGDAAKPEFINALSFLYLIGKINYQSSADVIELINV